jgi:hypothetical protein
MLSFFLNMHALHGVGEVQTEKLHLSDIVVVPTSNLVVFKSGILLK